MASPINFISLKSKTIRGVHEQSTTAGFCRSSADKARLEGWDVKRYRRSHDLPRTELSHVLHDTFLQIADDGFTTVPNLERIPAAKMASIGGGEGSASEIPF